MHFFSPYANKNYPWQYHHDNSSTTILFGEVMFVYYHNITNINAFTIQEISTGWAEAK